MNKLVTTSLLGVSLLTAAYAGVVPNLEVYKAEITKVRRTETPGKVLSLVQAADKELQSDLAVSLLKVVADRSHSLLPSTISTLASKFPALAADLAAEGAKLAPEYSTSIAQAAAVSAPEKSHLIAAAVAKQNPSKALRVARTVSEFVPERELQIAYLVSQIEPQVARGLSQELQSGFAYLNQEIQLSFDFLANFNLFPTGGVRPEGFLSQQTSAQTEAIQLMNDLINKAVASGPLADAGSNKIKITEQISTLLGKGAKLEDIRNIAKGTPVVIGGQTIAPSDLIQGSSVTEVVSLDDAEFQASQANAEFAVIEKVKELVQDELSSGSPNVATLKNLTGITDDETIGDLISGESTIDLAGQIETNVKNADGKPKTIETEPQIVVDVDAYGAV